MKWIITILFIFAFPALADDCAKNRAVLEIGAYSTKLFQAEVDICQNKIKKTLVRKTSIINFHQGLENKRPLRFKNKALEKAEQSIIKLIKQLQGSPELIILANNLFKETTNGKDFLRKLNKQSSKVIFVSANTKAILNFISAYSILGGSAEKYLIWDIGASGMNMTAYEGGTYHTHKDNLSSLTFKNMVLNAVKKKTHLKNISPNPLGKEGVHASIEMIRLYTRFELKKEFLDLTKKRILIGIGGVHTKSLKNLVPNSKNYYSLEEIKLAIDKYADKKDEQIKSPSPDMQVTNLIMIYGQMLELGQEALLTINTNMIHSSLLYPEFWATHGP